MWNVNTEKGERGKNIIIELIETLWNVNEEPEEPEQKPKKELIETLWNVNVVLPASGEPYTRINRNIVECKC